MTVLILRHIANNTLGPLETALTERQLPFQYVDCEAVTPEQRALDGITGLVLLGGRESAADDHQHAYMQPEQALIRHAIAQGVPVFGICLGSQMMARALGAAVEKNRVNGQEQKEIGWKTLTLSAAGEQDPVMRHLAGQAQFQWHEDTYHLPVGAVHLARSAACAQQAFRWNDKTYGVQFHPEMSLPVIQAWLDESDRLNAGDKATIRAESESTFRERHAASLQMFRAFWEQALSV